MCDAIAGIRMESKAREPACAPSPLAAGMPPETPASDLGKQSSQESVHVGGWWGGRVLPVPVCSVLGADAPPRACGEKEQHDV